MTLRSVTGSSPSPSLLRGFPSSLKGARDYATYSAASTSCPASFAPSA